jgi:hypothetical protein
VLQVAAFFLRFDRTKVRAGGSIVRFVGRRADLGGFTDRINEGLSDSPSALESDREEGQDGREREGDDAQELDRTECCEHTRVGGAAGENTTHQDRSGPDESQQTRVAVSLSDDIARPRVVACRGNERIRV